MIQQKTLGEGEEVKFITCDNKKLYDIELSRAAEKISTELDGETVILDIASGIYSGLDPVGTTIWNILETPVRFGDVVAEIVGAYDVSEEQCSDDLIEFLNSMLENGLVEIRSSE